MYSYHMVTTPFNDEWALDCENVINRVFLALQNRRQNIIKLVIDIQLVLVIFRAFMLFVV